MRARRIGAVVISAVVIAVGANASAVAFAQTGKAKIDPNGVLRIATPQFERIDMKVDAANSYAAVNHLGMMSAIFGTPLQLANDGSVQPWLAKSYEIVDPQTMKLTLRDGLKFQDGKPYDAQTLADTIMKQYKPLEKSATFSASILSDITSIDVNGPTEMTFRLARPVAGLLPINLATTPIGIVASPGSVDGKIYGAGPYQLSEYVPMSKVVAEKWDGFFDAKNYKVNEVQWLSIPTVEAAQNALQADQVDLISVNPRDAEPLERLGSFKTLTTNNQATYILPLCTAAPPFNDPKFREAFDLAINREQVAQVVFGGHAEALESLWTPGAPLAVEGLYDTDGNAKKATKILKQINYDPNKEITIGVFPGFAVHQLMAENIAGQLAKVGIKANVTQMAGGAFIRYTNPQNGGTHVTSNINVGVEAVRVPGVNSNVTVFNPCGASLPELAKLTDKLSAGELSKKETTEAWNEMQQIVADERLWLPIVTQPVVYVYNTDHVQGLEEGTVGGPATGSTIPSPFLNGVSIKRSN